MYLTTLLIVVQARQTLALIDLFTRAPEVCKTNSCAVEIMGFKHAKGHCVIYGQDTVSLEQRPQLGVQQ